MSIVYNSLPLTYEEQVAHLKEKGLLSKFYDNLNHNCPVKKIVAQKYSLNYEILSSWLRHLNVIRNICAHHGVLYNHHFAVIPITQRRVIEPLIPDFNHGKKRLFNSLLILKFFAMHYGESVFERELNRVCL
jgi:abortive infection bacteriophage resistance protein